MPLEWVLDQCAQSDSRLKNRLIQTFLDKDSETVSPGQALLFWFADLIQCAPIGKLERWNVIKEFADSIVEFGNYLAGAIEGRNLDQPAGKLPVAKIGIGGRAFVTMTGRNDMLDLETGDIVAGSSSEFLETIQYNLTALYVGHFRNSSNSRPER